MECETLHLTDETEINFSFVCSQAWFACPSGKGRLKRSFGSEQGRARRSEEGRSMRSGERREVERGLTAFDRNSNIGQRRKAFGEHQMRPRY
jgi:hypothetical protein